MSDKATKKGFRDQLGDGYVSLLDSVRHSFEQAAWGQETSGDLSSDFYRWAGAEPTPQPVQAGLGEGVQPMEVMPMEGRPSNLSEREAEATAYARHQEAGVSTAEMDNAHGYEWREFADWIEGKGQARTEPERGMEREGPELGD